MQCRSIFINNVLSNKHFVTLSSESIRTILTNCIKCNWNAIIPPSSLYTIYNNCVSYIGKSIQLTVNSFININCKKFKL